jgi:signal transduction histidine kinase
MPRSTDALGAGRMSTRLRQAIAPALLFWAAWALLRWQWPQARWPVVAAQMWLAYSVAWLLLPWRWWGLGVPLGAVLGGVLGMTLVPAIGPAAWLSLDTLARHALPAISFALLLHLPTRWWRWREEQKLRWQLARAEQTAAMADLSRQVSVSELRALQAQVEPHFLFNALASLQQLIRSQPATAERFLGELHDYLRMALPSMREPLSTVDKELALARAYLTVMATRLGERLRFELHAADGCATHPVPPMLLLTLVENAVRHGIEPLAQGGQVNIQARHAGDSLVLEVSDDGAGLQTASTSPMKGLGLGLANVRDRLASLYGAGAALSVQQRPEGGVSARMTLPWSGAETITRAT